MPNAALFVDLPNFYSRLLKSGIEEPRFLRDYFLYWLDYDLLAKSLADVFSGIWVFYSGERLGPSDERIADQYLKDYIHRINNLEGVTARDVNIPNEQREPIRYKCDKCGHEGNATSVSEKGVDTSLIVHLFDTMNSWDTAFLLSGDADFVPAVASLRRMGKIVIGVGFSDASPALMRECYNYINIREVYLEHDVLIYSIFKLKGIAQQWLTDEIQPANATVPEPAIRMSISWMQSGFGEPITYRTGIFATRGVNLANRNPLLMALRQRFPKQKIVTGATGESCEFHLSQAGFDSMKRRLELLHSAIPESRLIDSSKSNESLAVGKLDVEYQFDEETKRYKPVLNLGS